MSGRSRGRPKANASTLSSKAIVAAAIELLDAAGPSGFTMRALAARLGITPMSIYHHVGSRETLLGLMAETVLAGIGVADVPSPRARLEALLAAYCRGVIAHPNMMLVIFADPALYAGAAERLTRRVAVALRRFGLGRIATRQWRDILIDYTHGFAIAAAAAPAAGRAPGLDAYRTALVRLLDAAERDAASRS